VSLQAGQTLLHYRIVDKLGEGGMGIVWRAVDTNLDREVAIKVLPQEVAADTERLARFEREAKLLASLNHPNIATVHGLHRVPSERAADAQPTDAGPGALLLAMELIDGADLAERLAAAPLPLAESLRIAREVATALEAAHARGVIHRDLKPANIQLTDDGRVKVLDFGLAKMLESAAASESATESRTLTSAGTLAGVVLGTAAYMSPEQARGRPADRRSDIWAFGVVLFEMLAGERLFLGDSLQDTLAAVLRDEPDLERLPADTPPRVRRLLRRCLERDPNRRLQAIGEARIALDDELGGVVDPERLPPAETALRATPPTNRAPWRAAFWIATTVAVAAILFAVFGGAGEESAAVPSERLVADLALPAGWLPNSVDGPPALSPDGRRVALIAESPDGGSSILLRDLGSGELRELEGTRNALTPFWSADGRSLAFFAGGLLKRIDLDGGAPLILAEAPLPCGGSWSSDGQILFSRQYEQESLFLVDAAGNEVRALPPVLPEATGSWALWPRFLPDGNRFLVTVANAGEQLDGIYLGSLDAAAPPRRLLSVVSNATFVEPDWLVYWERSSVVAHRVDPETLAPSDEVYRVADGVAFGVTLMSGRFAVSRQTLVFQPGAEIVGDTEIVIVDRAGRELQSVAERAEYYFPRLSHDERRIAVDITELEGFGDVWTIDLERGTRGRITRTFIDASMPLWTLDDRALMFHIGPDLYRRDVSGTTEAELLLKSEERAFPQDISPDGRYLLYARGDGGLWTLDLQTGETRSWLSTDEKSWARFSPDGSWIAYTSTDSGRSEVYLQRFPEADERVIVSTDGGRTPKWRGDGGELYYSSPAREIVAVPVTWENGRPRPGRPEVLFQARLREEQDFDVSADGQRFVLNRVLPVDFTRPYVLQQNWTEGL